MTLNQLVLDWHFWVLAAIYFTPTMFAIKCGRSIVTVFAVNLVFGWSIIGWVVCFLMVLATPDEEWV